MARAPTRAPSGGPDASASWSQEEGPWAWGPDSRGGWAVRSLPNLSANTLAPSRKAEAAARERGPLAPGLQLGVGGGS